MKRHWKKLALLAVLVAAAVAVRLAGLDEYLSFEALKANRGALKAYVDAHLVSMAAVFIGVYAASVTLSVPGAWLLTIAGGFLFGAFGGTVLVNAGATAGATGAFLTARYVLGGWMQGRWGEKLAAFNEEIARNGISYLFTLRLIPVFPFFLVNFLVGLTRVPLGTFVWTTSIGIIPGSFVYAYAGSRLVTLESPGDIVSPGILLALALLGLLAALPAIVEKLRKRK
ncbi:MAG: TVP38/TMEM64 family protein [Spirochaetes bacterium]|nr:MAG: TVP38/TMEM64 family protein [Spirochaetota bacterium]